MSALRIVRLQAENIKKLRAIEIRPKGNVIEITGNNGAGKSSILDAIFWALAGTKHVQAKPIRDGEESARIVVDMGELVVTRTFKRGADGEIKPSLRVEGADGAVFSKPQTILDSLLGTLSFDPIEFEHKAPKEQFEALRRFVPDFDFEALDAQTRGDMERRRDANRDAKQKLAAAELIAIPENFTAIDETAIIEAMTSAAEFNEAIGKREERRRQVTQRIAEIDRRAADLQRDIAAMEERIAVMRSTLLEESAEAEELREKIAEAEPLPERRDVADLRAQLDAARKHNAAGGRAAEKARLLEQAQELEAEALRLTLRMEERERTKREAIEQANLPIRGLSFGDGCILLNGQPFEQASAAERLTASVAIAMASNSRLRVIRISEGALMDPDTFEALEDLAERFDAQVFVESVASGRPSAIVIEDGAVKSFGSHTGEEK
ncbi:AAA family ATPase [Methylosinus sporium]|uniref:Rad50/SbcC-type AAA domain-containing protein n=1 Tax=Methylosinus sporium TaxID=428 RepID=A0A2U1SSV7_METSR|nr:AAA family ATPase [Methylosinus sporium]PWB94701.1 hypothetical protein C5689_06450 [Methylosinus sporium]